MSQVYSVSLTNNTTLNNSNWNNVPGLVLTFTAKSDKAFVTFTASGYGFTNSMAYAEFRITTNNITQGGTSTTIQKYNANAQSTVWNCAYTKMITGLTPGVSYNLRVQQRCFVTTGNGTILIEVSSYPDSDHATLSVIPF